jgi:hypothetical protein
MSNEKTTGIKPEVGDYVMVTRDDPQGAALLEGDIAKVVRDDAGDKDSSVRVEGLGNKHPHADSGHLEEGAFQYVNWDDFEILSDNFVEGRFARLISEDRNYPVGTVGRICIVCPTNVKVNFKNPHDNSVYTSAAVLIQKDNLVVLPSSYELPAPLIGDEHKVSIEYRPEDRIEAVTETKPDVPEEIIYNESSLPFGTTVKLVRQAPDVLVPVGATGKVIEFTFSGPKDLRVEWDVNGRKSTCFVHSSGVEVQHKAGDIVEQIESEDDYLLKGFVGVVKEVHPRSDDEDDQHSLLVGFDAGLSDPELMKDGGNYQTWWTKPSRVKLVHPLRDEDEDEDDELEENSLDDLEVASPTPPSTDNLADLLFNYPRIMGILAELELLASDAKKWRDQEAR